MFDKKEVRQVVELQEISYRLLRWVGDALDSQVVSFNRLHEAMSASDAANEWIRRHWENIPQNMRPDQADIDAFARLFSSYLTTSFELNENPKATPLSNCGCYCPWCSYLAAGKHLKTKKLTKRARRDAVKLKHLYLGELARSIDQALGPSQLEGLCDGELSAYHVSLTTYAAELVRRTQFASQGEGVLVLWREIAWIDNHPQRNFRLDAEQILAAEQQLLSTLTQSG